VKAAIIIVTIFGLASVIGVIVVGMRSFEGIVVEKPYETGLAWDSLEKEKASLGWKVEVRTKGFRTGDNDLLLLISDREGKPLSAADVSITVSRPSTSAYDKTYRADEQPGGIYNADVRLPLFGHWEMKIRVASGGKRAVFDEKIFAEKGPG